MDRAIFNLTKYSIFLYLHCTDTQINKHYSSALLPLSVTAGVRITWPTFMTADLTILAHTLSHAHTSALINVIEEKRRGKQNFCRKPEVAYPTIPPTLPFHKPLPIKVRGDQPDAASWLACMGKYSVSKKTLATELGGFSPGVLLVLVQTHHVLRVLFDWYSLGGSAVLHPGFRKMDPLSIILGQECTSIIWKKQSMSYLVFIKKSYSPIKLISLILSPQHQSLLKSAEASLFQLQRFRTN